MSVAFARSKDAALQVLEIADHATRARLKSMVDLVVLKPGTEITAAAGLYVMFEGSARVIDASGSSISLEAPCVVDATEMNLADGGSIVVVTEQVLALAFAPMARAVLFGATSQIEVMARESTRLTERDPSRAL